MNLKGKNAIITGANRGIGKAILLKMAEKGINIWACVRHENDEFTEFIRDIEQKHGIWIHPIYFDLSDEEQIKSGIKTIISEKKEASSVCVRNI